ncbi:MAG: hypothetical protein PHV06_10665 [bacterium]|nr:hypothetical protein [bacterium]
MKRIFLFGLMIFISFTVLQANAINSLAELNPETLSRMEIKVEGDKISIDAVNVELSELIQGINSKCNLNIKIEDNLYGRTTIKLKDDFKNIEKMLEEIIEMTICEYEIIFENNNDNYRILQSKKKRNKNYYSEIIIKDENKILKKLENYEKMGVSPDDIDNFKYEHLFINRKGINTGKIIVYGEFISPPYELLVLNNSIYLNGILIYPTQDIFENNIIERKSFQLGYKEYYIEDFIHRNFFILKKILGEECAKKLLVEYLDYQPMIEEYKFIDNNLYLKQRKESSFKIMLLNRAPNIEETEDELILREKYYKYFTSFRKNCLLVIGYNHEIIINDSEPEKIIKDIDYIMGLEIDEYQKESLLNHIFKDILNSKEAVSSIMCNYKRGKQE